MKLRRAALWAALLMLRATTAGSVPAFPGAAGFGSETPGGRGGRVLFVTNINDSGRGSLRAAIETPGRRIVIFRTGGTIVLASTLEITHPFITIAGQSAPGGGIQIRNDSNGSRAADSFPSIRIATNDVVIRFLRIRPGMLDPDPACAGRRPKPKGHCVEPNDIDGINLAGPASNIVIDHVSASWASDEIIGAGAARDFTLQWSILSEGIDFMLYTPGKTYDGKGMLLGNTHEVERGHPSGRVSIHHNLWAHNSIRSPMLNPSCPAPSHPSRCVVDVVNNLVYDWTAMGTHVSNGLGHTFANIVANYFKIGPSTGRKALAIGLRDWTATSTGLRPGSKLGVYLDGNIEETAGRRGGPASLECYRLGRGADGRQAVLGDCDVEDVYRNSSLAVPPVRTGDALEIVTPVLSQAGASMRLDERGSLVPARDTTDQRIVREFEEGTGRVITGIAQIPDWPVLDRGVAPRDSDRDGMPDRWERQHEFDRDAAAAAGADTDGDGYTDVEEYLNGTDPHVPG